MGEALKYVTHIIKIRDAEKKNAKKFVLFAKITKF